MSAVRIGAPPHADEAAAAFRAARGVDPFGPFEPLLHHPLLLGRVEALGRAVRYEGTLAPDVREAAILATATAWNQRVEWAIHAPVAAAAGVSPATLDAIGRGRDPEDAPEPQRAAVGFVRQLHLARDVDDDAFAVARALFGEAGVVELTALAGYYALLAMVMNVSRTEHRTGEDR